MKTLNQLTDAVREWTNKHPLINDFGTGPTNLIGQSESMEFPYLWLNFAPNHSININENSIIPIPKFQFIVMDKTHKNVNPNRDGNGLETSDGMEVKSDTYRLVLDLLKWLNEQSYIKIDNASIQSIIDETKEVSSGWLIELDIKMMFLQCGDLN